MFNIKKIVIKMAVSTVADIALFAVQKYVKKKIWFR